MESNENPSADRYGSVSDKKSGQDGSTNRNFTLINANPYASSYESPARAKSHTILNLCLPPCVTPFTVQYLV